MSRTPSGGPLLPAAGRQPLADRADPCRPRPLRGPSRSFDDAVSTIDAHDYGNGTAIFRASGRGRSSGCRGCEREGSRFPPPHIYDPLASLACLNPNKIAKEARQRCSLECPVKPPEDLSDDSALPQDGVGICWGCNRPDRKRIREYKIRRQCSDDFGFAPGPSACGHATNCIIARLSTPAGWNTAPAHNGKEQID